MTISANTSGRLPSAGAEIGLVLDYCPDDFSIWFDFFEPKRFMKWVEKYAPPGWRNPSEPSSAAVMAALHFDSHITGP